MSSNCQSDIGCRAITSRGVQIEVCGNEVYGRNGTNEIQYCRDHVPTGAAQGLVRVDKLEFYIPELNTIKEAP